MTEEWIRAMAVTHVDVDEAMAQIPRLVHLAVSLARCGHALATEVERLRNERDAAINLLEGYDPDLARRLREQIEFEREPPK